MYVDVLPLTCTVCFLLLFFRTDFHYQKFPHVLPKPAFQVTLTSADGVTAPQRFNTNTVDDNGFNPVWESPAEPTKFTVHNSDLQMLCFEVWDEDKLSKNDFIGSFVVPVKMVRFFFR